MKMAKSLLLGSAAGIVAVAGAQAADLPVKAKPVEYVKVCSLYGAGYYYIPGTDICQKIGGYVRYENTYGFGEQKTAGPWQVGAVSTTNLVATSQSGLNTRNQGASDFVETIRAYITAETRQQTQYGTLRTYLNVGVNVDLPTSTTNVAQSAGGFNANRAFIQIAGFTMGKATSFYDFYSAPATGLFAAPSSDIGDGGQVVTAYTMQFGNGLSASISLEDASSRRQATINGAAAANTTGLLSSAIGGSASKKIEFPDVVANLRIDQAWGSAQIMGALHDASGAYNGTAAGSQTGAEATGTPGDKWGFAVGAGVKINMPMISAGDYIQAQVNYAQGASKYVAVSLGSSNAVAFRGNTFGFGQFSDGVYCGAVTAGCAGGAGAVQLTTAWGVNAAYEHFWTPALRTSLIFSYFNVSYNGAANAIICGDTAGLVTGSCSNNYSWWTVGSRSQWNVTKDFYLATDVIYMNLNTASSGASYLLPAQGANPAGTYTVSNQSALGLRWRAHRDIVP